MKLTLLVLCSCIAISFAQPPAPSGNELPCNPEPTGTSMDVPMDCEGYQSIFNGESFDGWWHSCQTNHSSPDPANGGIWKVDVTEEAIYSNQRANGAGSILMTNKIYKNYELFFDFWPDFGNDAGIFNRTNPQGICQQVVLDYINGSSVGGHWSEAGWAGQPRWIPPFKMGANEETITDRSGWSYTGEWLDAWDPNYWNNFRIATYGFPPTVATWMKKVDSENWISVLDEYTFGAEVNSVPKDGHIGLQIHANSGRWGGRKGNWYRNIRVRELDDAGQVAANPPAPVIFQQPFLAGTPAAGQELKIQMIMEPNINPACDQLITFQWVKDGTPLLGANQPEYTIPAASDLDNGTYHVEISNPVGTNKAVSDPVTVQIGSAVPYEIQVPGIKLMFGEVITGTVNQAYTLTVYDVGGNQVSGFSGSAGTIYHPIPRGLSGVLFVKLSTTSFTKSWKVLVQ